MPRREALSSLYDGPRIHLDVYGTPQETLSFGRRHRWLGVMLYWIMFLGSCLVYRDDGRRSVSSPSYGFPGNRRNAAAVGRDWRSLISSSPKFIAIVEAADAFTIQPVTNGVTRLSAPGQLAYDADGDALYLSDIMVAAIFRVSNLACVSVTSPITWTFELVAGGNGPNSPGTAPVPNAALSMNKPHGLVPWTLRDMELCRTAWLGHRWNNTLLFHHLQQHNPTLAPSPPSPPMSPAGGFGSNGTAVVRRRSSGSIDLEKDIYSMFSDNAFGGIFLMVYGGFVLMHTTVHTRIGPLNSKIVAGVYGMGGHLDGVGPAATVNNPYYGGKVYLPWMHDDAPTGTLGGRETRDTTSGMWMMAIVWADLNSHCFRQAYPASMVDITAPYAFNMDTLLLNVSSFIGLCGLSGSGDGPAWLTARFVEPISIAVLQSSFQRPSMWTSPFFSSAFLGESFSGGNRLTLAAPLFPKEARYLSTVLPSTPSGVTPILVAMASHITTVELYYSGATSYMQSTIKLIMSPPNATVAPTPGVPSDVDVAIRVDSSYTTSTVLVTPGDRWMILVPRYVVPAGETCPVAPPWNLTAPYPLGRLAVLTGGASRLMVAFNASLPWVGNRPAWVSASKRQSFSGTIPSLGSLSHPRSGTASSRPSPSATDPVTPASATVSSRSVFVSRSRSLGRRTTAQGVTGGGARPPPVASHPPPVYPPPPATRNISGNRSDAPNIPLLLASGATTSNTVGAGTIAIVATAAMVPVAASKAAVPGRALSVWQCTAVGPAQAAADDPQQFLNFGLPIGGGGGDDGLVLGALILTGGIRLVVFIVLILLLKTKYTPSSNDAISNKKRSKKKSVDDGGSSSSSAPPSTFGAIIAVSVGYFSPNVIGLCTSVLLSTGSSSVGSMVCAVGALALECVMIILVSAAVWDRGGRVLRTLAMEYIEPIRRRRRWYFRIAGLEDVVVALLIAVCSNIPRVSSDVCLRVAWALLILSALHLLYVVLLRPFRERLDVGVSIFLALVNTAFALLCCLVARDGDSAWMVSTGLQVVTGCFYLSLAISIVVSIWETWQKSRRRN